MKTKAGRLKKNIVFLPREFTVRLPGWESGSSEIVALAVILKAWRIDIPDIDALIKEALGKGAHEPGRGWNLRGIAAIAERYGLRASDYDWKRFGDDVALGRLQKATSHAPCIASIHKGFLPENGANHAIVVTKISRHWVFYCEPTARKRRQVHRKVSRAVFQRGWTKCVVIVMR